MQLRPSPKSLVTTKFSNVERHVDHVPFSSEPIGIDVGLNKFAVLSNGEEIDNPRHLRKKEKALQKAQQKSLPNVSFGGGGSLEFTYTNEYYPLYWNHYNHYLEVTITWLLQSFVHTKR